VDAEWGELRNAECEALELRVALQPSPQCAGCPPLRIASGGMASSVALEGMQRLIPSATWRHALPHRAHAHSRDAREGTGR
jgi:hypothetical protein